MIGNIMAIVGVIGIIVTLIIVIFSDGRCPDCNGKLIDDDIEKHNKIVEFEREISILLSCKNCSENKGGLLCQKEYEDKCLAQKIQYIKELQEENAELKEQIEALANVNIKAQNIIGEAKEIIRNLLRVTYGEGWNYSLDVKVKAEQFLKENEIKC